MADTKISALPEVTTPDSSDVLPIVSSGVNKKITVQHLAVQGLPGPAGPKGPGMVWHGAYNAGHDYNVGDGVAYLGSSYICKLASTGNFPTNATYWDVIVAKGDPGTPGADGVGEKGDPGDPGPPGSMEHALSAHTVATVNLLLGGHQIQDQVIQTVADEAAVFAYSTPIIGKWLFSLADLAVYVCTAVDE